MQGDGPKDVLTVIKAAAKGAGSVLSSDVVAADPAGSVIQTVEHLPSVGKVVAKSAMDMIVSGAGEHKLSTTMCALKHVEEQNIVPLSAQLTGNYC